MKKLLITGCGRSGTKFIKTLLEKSKIDVDHEFTIKKNGLVTWGYFESKYKPKYMTRLDNTIFDKQYIQLRNPQEVSVSMHGAASSKNVVWPYIEDVIPIIKNTNDFRKKSVLYWIYWNLKLFENIKNVYSIENYKPAYYKICEDFSRKPLNKKDLIFLENKKINKRIKKYFDHREFLDSDIKNNYDEVYEIYEKAKLNNGILGI